MSNVYVQTRQVHVTMTIFVLIARRSTNRKHKAILCCVLQGVSQLDTNRGLTEKTA